MSGMDDPRRQPEQKQRKMERPNGRHSVAEIMSPAFMREHTPFDTFEEMCDAVGVTTTEQFAAFPAEAWDEHVRATTQYTSWDEMQRAAGEAWAARRVPEGP